MKLLLSSDTVNRCTEALVSDLLDAHAGPASMVSIYRGAESVGTMISESYGKKKPPKWVTAALLAVFVRDRVHEIADRQRRELGDLTVQELPILQTPEVAAEQVIAELNSLPWMYRAIIPVPVAETLLHGKDLILDDAFTLRIYDEAEASSFGCPQIDSEIARYYHREYPRHIEPSVYLTYRKTGYVRDSDGVEDLQEFTNGVKGLLGLLEISGLASRDIFPPHTPPPAVPIFLFRESSDGKSALLGYRWLTHDDSAAVRLMKAQRSYPHYEDPEATLQDVAAAFRHQATRTAARWYLDSTTGGQTPLAIVQATIVLEILFGDRTEANLMGLASLLANRLAYGIGRTPKQRDRIIKEVKRLYDIRSTIVHAGAAEIDDSARHALYDLQQFAREALNRQIRGVADDERSERGSLSSG